MRKTDKTQQAILDYIAAKIQTDGYAPSVREIACAVGLRSPSTVHSHLGSLERKGLLQKEDGKMRTLRLSARAAQKKTAVMIPLIRQVSSGVPFLAPGQIEGYIPVDARLLKGQELFAIRARGDSMVNAAILDNDIVIVEKTAECKNGEIVVALMKGEAAVRRFYKDKDCFRLQPENPDHEPFLAKDLTILGRVVGCIRYY